MTGWHGRRRAGVLGDARAQLDSGNGNRNDREAGSGSGVGSAGSSLPRAVAAHADTSSANRDTR